MRFDVEVTRETTDLWKVRILAVDSKNEVVAERHMPRTAKGAKAAVGFPLPDPG